MIRISRTAALSAAALLALGITACSPPNQKNSDAPQITTVTPERGYEGAGLPETSAAESTESGTQTGIETGLDAGYVDSAEPTAH
ncbi:hypothetical protein [uncultured Corynebacterium sp.]|uniref:hypothetical protein n=1 Tax=uncultured Corynebacterium sp. TaxID=159447 RepID=UPI0025F85C28|nr:hypothetical protein [uncultured Corynebacterium sp.]